MNRIRVVIADDEAPARTRFRRLLAEHPDVDVVDEAADGADALARIHAKSPDLVFLDVQMPELDGLGVARSLPTAGPLVVFVTAFDEHAIRAFELAAVDYLLKPVAKDRLAVALDRVRDRLRRGNRSVGPTGNPASLPRPTRVAVRSGAKFVVFDVARIAAVIAKDHYAAVLVDGTEHLSDDSLDTWLARLDGDDFLRVHRSAIVNVRHVSELLHEGDRKYVAVLSDPPKTHVAIARERLEAVKAKLGIV
ncbi:MAG: LytTR family DNA-binding domain-containing protein [Polyangiaceae bacterium]